jgi:hypothetical protein
MSVHVTGCAPHGHASHWRVPRGPAPLGRASHGSVPHWACTSLGVHLISVYLMNVYLMGVHLMGLHLIGVHLMGVYLMGLHLTGPASHGCVPLGRVPHWCVPHRACISWAWCLLRLLDFSIWGSWEKSLHPTAIRSASKIEHEGTNSDFSPPATLGSGDAFPATPAVEGCLKQQPTPHALPRGCFGRSSSTGAPYIC